MVYEKGICGHLMICLMVNAAYFSEEHVAFFPGRNHARIHGMCINVDV